MKIETRQKELPADRPAIDIEILKQRVGHHADIIDELLREFRNCLQTDRATLENALISDNQVLAADVAHRLKSSCSTIGAMRLAECCKEIERWATNESERTSSDLLGIFSRDAEQVLLALDANHPE